MAVAGVAELFGGGYKRRFREVGPLPVSGATVRIRSLTARELSAYEAQAMAANGQGVNKQRLLDADRRLIALCVVDENGNTIITPKHVDEMADWDSADVQELYRACAEFVGFRQIDKEQLEALGKN